MSKFGPCTEIASSDIGSEGCSTAVEAPVGTAVEFVVEDISISIANTSK